ncbi:hypothetical protein [Streptomyces resistomycificus]|uniref:hypothetical protein n=1 Tax=Streptomyces resistomycificus TaxID=67356 RepID=UPI000FE19C60|nr:hypothetical protein [Streptomyces resistomycificus]
MELTPRVKRRIARDYAEKDRKAVEEVLVELMESLEGGGGEERIVAAAILFSHGQVDKLLTAVEVALEDWRDILMISGLQHGDWPERLDSEFGTDS